MPDSVVSIQSNRAPATVATALARGVGTAVLALSFFVFILALRPFAYGIWFQSEPVTAGLLVLGAVSGLCLVALDLTGHRVANVLVRPPVQILMAFVAWNGLASCLQQFPARSWFGSPEVGEGIFAFLALLVLIVLAMTLWPIGWCRRLVAGAAALSALSIAGLDGLLPQGSPWRPEMFASYAGAIGPAVALIVAGVVPRPESRRFMMAALAGLPVVVLSQNKTAIGLYCVVGPLAWLSIGRLPEYAWRTRRILTWAPVLAVVVAGIVLAVPLAFPWYDPLYSLRSRGLLALVGLKSLLVDPSGLLIGFGWGSYNDLLYRHTFIWGVRGFHDAVWNPDWEAIGAGSFHSHYEILETVLACGLLGGLLYLMLFRSLIREARTELLHLSAVVWLLQVGCASFWFPFMLSFPFLAAAIASSTVPINVVASKPVRVLGVPRCGVVLAVVGVLTWGAIATAQDAIRGGRLLQALNRQDRDDIARFGTLADDHGRGGTHLWWTALNYAAFISGQMAGGQKPGFGQALWYLRVLDEVDRWTAEGRAGVRLAALALALRNEIISSHENTLLAELRTRELARWGDVVLQVIRLAPDRTDVAVPYLGWLATSQHYLPILSICARVFERHPGDRVCLWYAGFAMLTDPLTEAAGLADMHTALALGVDAVVPVTREARASVESHFPPIH